MKKITFYKKGDFETGIVNEVERNGRKNVFREKSGGKTFVMVDGGVLRCEVQKTF